MIFSDTKGKSAVGLNNIKRFYDSEFNLTEALRRILEICEENWMDLSSKERKV